LSAAGKGNCLRILEWLILAGCDQRKTLKTHGFYRPRTRADITGMTGVNQDPIQRIEGGMFKWWAHGMNRVSRLIKGWLGRDLGHLQVHSAGVLRLIV
jgi:hypothetical protein